MKIIITLLRFLFGIVVGFAGCVAIVSAPYQMLNVSFSLTDSGPFVFVSLFVGGLMVWGAWRLIRGAITTANTPGENTVMKLITSALRIVFGFLVGVLGVLALLIAPWQLADANFSVANNGPLFLTSLIVGSLMFWAAWRLIRGPRVLRSTAAS